MGEILIRTNKDLYESGETIYGMIYLIITEPTAGTGVRLKFTGHEKYDFNIVKGLRDQVRRGVFDCDNINIYHDEGAPMAMGTYMFPFKKQLLQDLPGTFRPDSPRGEVKYLVEADFIGTSLKQEHEILLRQSIPADDGPPFPKDSAKFSTGIVFSNHVQFDAWLNKKTYTKEEMMELSLRGTNMNSLSADSIDRINIKVMQSVSVYPDKEGLKKRAMENSELEIDLNLISSVPEKVPLFDKKPEWAIYENIIRNHNMKDILSKTLVMKIPVKQLDKGFLSTTDGKYIKCTHQIDIDIYIKKSLGKTGHVKLSLPISSIAPAHDEEWHNWKPPPWTFDCTRVDSDNPCSVGKDGLASHHFAGFPGNHFI